MGVSRGGGTIDTGKEVDVSQLQCKGGIPRGGGITATAFSLAQKERLFFLGVVLGMKIIQDGHKNCLVR